ncbi:MAG: cation diffusion facilitator family transporter [Corallococcus sp.]|nr:cation diffusion facilitator family transporter [Corallococcus sp.]
MTDLLLKIFVKGRFDVNSLAVRDRVGKLSSVTCITLNLLLAVSKIVAGILFGLVSVFADGINNLGDCGSNAVMLVGIKVASSPADKEHPYGHRRAEYVAGTAVACAIIFVALELFVESVKKIIDVFFGNYDAPSLNAATVIILAVSMAVKLGMFFFNRKLAKRYDYDLLKASALDSASDVCATAAVLISVVASYFVKFDADGFAGVAVAVFIAVNGIKLLKETANHLMGEGANAELANSVTERIKKFDGVLGVHDLNIHNYGPNRYYASVHVEVDADKSVTECHDLIDGIERDFEENTDIRLVIHMDPVAANDPETDAYKAEMRSIVKRLDERFDIHDFRVVKSLRKLNFIFDVSICYDTKLTERDVVAYLQEEAGKIYPDASVSPKVERQ